MGSEEGEGKSGGRRFRWLSRHVPNRERLERIPLVGGLMRRARDAKFLWSLDRDEVASAFLVGWVVALSPLFGVHTILAILCVFLFRANLIIALAVQLVSTPLTIPFLWPFLYATGRWAVRLFSDGLMTVDLSYRPVAGAGRLFARALALITLGGTLVGFACTFISVSVFTIFDRFRRRREAKKRLEINENGGTNGT
ncbi:MAG: DUF2062 domain-containing protein [Puniceicoccales bacterium]|jgi:uncharacterized protein (DUF2062 family)|nr:DUF2062 domain-containing protein [Puniceicoccales bacterium]